MALWDGKRLVFRESRFWLLTLVRALWRYGMAPFVVRTYPVSTLAGTGALT